MAGVARSSLAAALPPRVSSRDAAAPSDNPASVVVERSLDVGQGDATLIENGGSRVLIDGGPESTALRRAARLAPAEQFDVRRRRAHAPARRPSHRPARAVRERSATSTCATSSRTRTPYTAANLRHLRDSVNARVARKRARLSRHRRPVRQRRADLHDHDEGRREAAHHAADAERRRIRTIARRAVKLVGPDSASFTMWLAGDAEQDEINWFLGRGALRCQSRACASTCSRPTITEAATASPSAYLDATHPTFVTASVGAVNSYHHMHAQAKTIYRDARHRRGIAPIRTVRSRFESPGTPGGKFTVAVKRGGRDLSGVSDKRSTQAECNPVP